MANRHLSRTIVLQTLFEWDFGEKKDSDLSKILEKNIEEFAPGGGDLPFMEKLLDGVVRKKKDLDKIIEKAAPDWPLDKISVVDRNILRVGLYELLFSDRKEVPPKVAINEAIEMAKSFGGDNSGKFINGVLGSVYREIGEPGKDDVSKKKPNKKIKDIPYEKMPVERLGGAVVFAKDGKDIYLALVHDIFGHWTLSKGHIEEGKGIEEEIKREIKEEIGLDVKLREKLGENEYVASDPEKGKIRKHVIYHLAEGPYKDLKLTEDTGGLDDAKWFKLAEIIDLNFYDDILPIVTKAVNILLAENKG